MFASKCKRNLDIGGFRAYVDFLEAIADPAHEAHAEMLEWYGSDFDVEDAGIDHIFDKFEYLSKKWAPVSYPPKIGQ